MSDLHDEAKPLSQSRTVWFNVLTAIATILSLPILPPVVLPYIPVAQAVVNIGLRIITKQPVRIGPSR